MKMRFLLILSMLGIQLNTFGMEPPVPAPSMQSASLACNDWNPLMRANAQLVSSIITSQSYINTVSALGKYLFLGATTIGAAVSAYKKSWVPIVATAGVSMLPWLFGSSLIKKMNATAIKNHYDEAQALISSPESHPEYVAHNNMSARAIIDQGSELLHSKDLCPPYPALKPISEYGAMLENLKEQLPLVDVTRASQESSSLEHWSKQNNFEKIHEKLPIVFDANYDISFGGLERLHPFDTKKYGKVSRYLLNKFNLTGAQFYQPNIICEADLLLVHSPAYLEALKSSFTLGLIADMPLLGLFPNKWAQKILLNPVLLATGGTILAADLALKHGWAINLSGGYHHAKHTEPVAGGFCIINDICIAAKKVLEKHPDYRILIVDLDAHQGNGHEDIARDWPQIGIFDVFNKKTWPGDFACQERINFSYPVDGKAMNDHNYLELLRIELPKAIDAVKPDFIIYNAGTDVYELDPIGLMAVTKQGIITRDELVFSQARERNIPILMVLSGGYHAHSHEIISKSIENLWHTWLIQK